VADRASASAFSVAGLSRVRRDPWLCGPASRPGCLVQGNGGRRRWPGAKAPVIVTARACVP